MDWAGLNCHSLAAHIGLDSAQSLYQIRAGKHGISRVLAKRLCEHYPELNYAWLLTGEGEMIKPRNKSVPYYACDCCQVALNTSIYTTPDGYVVLPDCGDATFAAYMRSEAMLPTIPNGALLLCRQCLPTELKAGDLCLMVYARQAIVRRLDSYDKSHIVLSDNDGRKVEIERTLITSAYSIRAVVGYTNG